VLLQVEPATAATARRPAEGIPADPTAKAPAAAAQTPTTTPAAIRGRRCERSLTLRLRAVVRDGSRVTPPAIFSGAHREATVDPRAAASFRGRAAGETS
jgi:hypothetical protein